MKNPLLGTLCLILATLTSAQSAATSVDVNEALGLATSLPATVLWQGTPGQPAVAQVVLEGSELTLVLVPTSVVAPGFVVLAQEEDGALRAAQVEAPRTYRGRTDAFGGARVAASWLAEGLFARIRTEAGDDYWIEPVPASVAGRAPLAHVLYSDEDVIASGMNCATEALPPSAFDAPSGGDGSTASRAIQVAELACDADFSYFQRYGSTTAVNSRIQNVVNTMNLQYESEVELTHQITAVVVRTSSGADPYSTTNSSTLLNQFANEWRNNQGSIRRDVAQLFTGRNLSGSVIGIAYLSAVCTNSGYSVVQSDFTGAFACVTDLSAHELGHNWGAGHCFCSGFTMNSSITCANRFSNGSQNAIRNFAGTRTCLSSQCAPAAVLTRSASPNPQVYTATPAVIGQPSTFTVDTQGFQFATIYGFPQSNNRRLDSGFVVLVNPDAAPLFVIGPLSGPTAQASMLVASSPALCGTVIYTQALLDSGPGAFALTNAQDLVIGQ